MLDNGAFGHSKVAQPASRVQTLSWGKSTVVMPIAGLRRKALAKNPKDQQERNALFTVGRLIREGRLEAFTYSELRWERFAQTIGLPEFDALSGCEVKNCAPAIERSRFQSGFFPEYVRKGGKKDRRAGLDHNPISQISFMEWLCTLRPEDVSQLMNHGEVLGFTEFEIESLRDLDCFQTLCRIGQAPENYPDIFHVWTAQRNRMDVFLTLEMRLPNIAKQFAITTEWKRGYPTKILRPTELLGSMGIENPDPVPIESDRFYPLVDL